MYWSQDIRYLEALLQYYSSNLHDPDHINIHLQYFCKVDNSLLRNPIVSQTACRFRITYIQLQSDHSSHNPNIISVRYTKLVCCVWWRILHYATTTNNHHIYILTFVRPSVRPSVTEGHRK